MGKALLAVALVAASFAGGAVANGPGLDRVKGLFRAGPPAGRIDTLPPGAMAGPQAEAEIKAEAKADPDDDIPSAPIPPLVVGDSDVSEPPTPAQPKPKAEAEIERPAAPAPAASIAPPPVSARETPMAPPPTAPAQAPGWDDLRRRMRELGVSRYWVEGEPGGPARFRCVIPLAGQRAVGQQFEAEGDDDLGAAEAALRRVALWRATESP